MKLYSNLQLLENIFGLNALKITKEDTAKTRQYIAEKKRTEVRRRFASVEDFIKSLSIKLHYSINNDSHIARISQLTNKTNQFNLTEEEQHELLPSGKQAIFDNRVGWARTHLKKAGLLESTRPVSYTHLTLPTN